MTEQLQPEVSERQEQLAKRLNEGMANHIGKLSLDIIALKAERDVLTEEKLILAEHVQQQAAKIEQLQAMLSLQNEGPANAAEVAPNREQRRAAEKKNIKVQAAPETTG